MSSVFVANFNNMKTSVCCFHWCFEHKYAIASTEAIRLISTDCNFKTAVINLNGNEIFFIRTLIPRSHINMVSFKLVLLIAVLTTRAF